LQGETKIDLIIAVGIDNNFQQIDPHMNNYVSFIRKYLLPSNKDIKKLFINSQIELENNVNTIRLESDDIKDVFQKLVASIGPGFESEDSKENKKES